MALQRALCYCRDIKSSSTMDTMLRVVAGTLSNNLAMIGNISFHSVKPLFNLRDVLLFIDSVAKKVLFLTKVVLLVSLKSSSITTHVSSKDLLQMLSFLPSQRRMSKSLMYRLLIVYFSKPLPLISIGAPPPSSQLLISFFLKSNKTR